MRPPYQIVGSNPARGMDICRLWVLWCCVLSGRRLCDGLITRPEEPFRLWCVILCDPETWIITRSWPALGSNATRNNCICIYIYIYMCVCVCACVCVLITLLSTRKYMYKAPQTYDNLGLRLGRRYRTPQKVGQRLYVLFTASRQMRS